jgi:thioesterase domain-containing protein/acyl carrier protein
MKKENIEDIVALLPMQQSFLWHSLQVDAASSVLQLRCTLRGNISLEHLKLAWGRVVQKHQALRSSVHWESVKKPIQVIHKQVPNDISLTNAISDSGNENALTQFLEQDRNQKLDLTIAPAFRIALFQTREDTCEVIWTLSHVLLDGWSCAVVVNDWVKIYSDLVLEDESVTTPGFLLSEYTRWIGSQDKQAMLEYWDGYLPSEIQLCAEAFQASKAADNLGSQPGFCQAVVSQEDFAGLQLSLRQAGLSLGTALQAAFATVLHAKDSEVPVVFGTTVSGRQVDIPQTESRVGMLTNLIPVSVEFDPCESVQTWLASLQTRFFSALPHAHASMADVLSLRPELSALYDCLLVLENQPSVISTSELEVSDYHSGIISEFALTLTAVPGADLQLDLRYRKDDFRHDDMDLLLQQCKNLLLALPSSLSEPMSWLNQYKRIASIADTRVPANDNHTYIENKTDTEPDELVTPALERKLWEIWCGILKTKHITLNDDFFELGGTSLQAMMLFDQIETKLGKRLPPITLFRAPTIADIAALIKSDQPDSVWSNIVGVNTSGTRVPIFIPFEQVDMLGFGPLCNELGPDQPVYGLRFPENVAPTDKLIETLVTHIKTLQPNGPYQLAGLSGAGMLAWRVAQNLQGRGNKVALLALLDSYGPAYPRLLPTFVRLSQIASYVACVFASKAKNAFTRFTSMLSAPVSSASSLRRIAQGQQTYNEEQHKEFMRRVAQEHALAPRFLREVAAHHSLIDRLVNRVILAFTKWRYHSNRLRIAYIMFMQGLLLESCISGQKSSDGSKTTGDETLQILRSSFDCLPANMPATRINLERYLTTYEGLQPYEGRLVFFRATQRPPGVVKDPLTGWKGLFPENAHVHAIPGNHTSMLKQPNVQVLAESLKQEVSPAKLP